jgi:hypothetical protein
MCNAKYFYQISKKKMVATFLKFFYLNSNLSTLGVTTRKFLLILFMANLY